MSIKGCVCNVLPGHRNQRGRGSPGSSRNVAAVAWREAPAAVWGWKHWSRYVGASNRGPRRTPGIDFSGPFSSRGFNFWNPSGPNELVPRLRIHFHIHLDFFFHASAKEQLEDSKRNNCISSSIFLARLTIVRYLIEQGPNRKWPKYQALHLYTPKTCFKRHIIWLAAISLMQHKFINTIQTESDWLKAFRPPENRKLEF